MKRKTQSKATQAMLPPLGGFPDFSDFWAEQQQVLDPRRFLRLSEDMISRTNGKLLGETSDIAQEVMNFGNERLKQNLEFASRFMQCQTSDDVAKVQQDWLRTAFKEYSASGTSIYEKCMNFMSDSMKIAAENASATVSHEDAIEKDTAETR